jgi:hypothetical protein
MRTQNSLASLVRSTLFTTLAVGTSASAATLNVPAAFPTIQDAIDAAVDGDTVLVAPGTYFERIDFLGKEIVVKASAFSDPTLTVIDADFLGTAVTIDGGVGPDAKLIGFTILEGDDTVGGGLYVAGDPTIRQCRFVQCQATSGGGAYVDGNATFTECAFIENDATGGGGLALMGNVLVEGCLFDGNHATGGGGVEILGDCDFRDCTFVANDATVASAAEVVEGIGRFDRCFFGDDDTTTLRTLDRLTIVNSLVVGGTRAVESSSALRAVEIKILNTTFHNEGASCVNLSDGGFDSILTVANSILRTCTDAIDVSGTGGAVETIDVTFSNVEGGWAGTGNIDAIPLYMDPATGDFRLARNSPCVDAGDNAAVPALTPLDLDGNARIANDVGVDDTGSGTGAIVDMGAYEATRSVRYVNVAAAGANDGLTWTDAYVDLKDALDEAFVTEIDYVLVAKGVYLPDRGTGSRNATFNVAGGLEVVGGFAGGETEISQRNSDANPTTLSGAIGGAGVTDNSYHVVVANDPAGVASLTGLIIQRGYADGAPVSNQDNGAGIFAMNSTLVVRDCWIRQNETTGPGAGIYAINAEVGVYDSRLNLNVAGGNGGAMGFFGGLPVIANTLVHGNEANGEGAISLVGNADGLIVNATIADNETTGGGAGGVYVGGAAALYLRNSILWKNAGMFGTNEMQQITSAGLLDVAATTVQGWSGALGGSGNTGSDPLFANPVGPDGVSGNGDDDYRLTNLSNAIDNAMSEWLPEAFFPLDLGNAERFVDDLASADNGTGPIAYLDRGCYEYQAPACPTDLNGDGQTDGADLAIMLGSWGGSGPADVNASGSVNGADLAILLGAWGPC